MSDGRPVYFVSFTERDKAVADELQQALARIFRGRIELRVATRIGFENWRAWIRRSLRECRGVIALWSKNSLPSQWIYVEVGVCAYEGKHLFNIVVDPDQLARFKETPFADEQAHVLSPDLLHALIVDIATKTGIEVAWDTVDVDALHAKLQELLARRDDDVTDRLRKDMRQAYPRYFPSFADDAFHPLFLGYQFFQGFKRGVDVVYNDVANAVVVTGGTSQHVPTFGSELSQPVKPSSRLCIEADIRSIGETAWTEAFFRLDVANENGDHFALTAVEPAGASVDNDRYVKLPRDQSRVLYLFAFPEGFTRLTRMQVVLAPNSHYDLTFRHFAVVDL